MARYGTSAKMHECHVSHPRVAAPVHTPAMTTDAAGGGRRERKRRDTRTALAASALELFEERGVAATTIEDITERADVARRTFFRYFPSKEAVLFPDPSEYEDRLLATLDALEPPFTMGRLLDAFADGAVGIEDDVALQRRRAAVVAANRLDLFDTAMANIAAARDTIVRHLAERTGLAETDRTLLLGVSLGLFAMAHAYGPWAGGESEGTLRGELDGTVELLRGLLTDETGLDGTPL